MPSGHTRKCTYSHTPPEDPLEMVQCHPPMSLPASNTPPDSLGLLPIVTLNDAQATEMANTIAAIQMTATTLSSHLLSSENPLRNPPPLLTTPYSPSPGDNQLEDVIAEASKLEFKTVDEMYVSNAMPIPSQLTRYFHPVRTGRLIYI